MGSWEMNQIVSPEVIPENRNLEPEIGKKGLFQSSLKIINAFSPEMGFAGRVKPRTNHLPVLPACNGSRFSVLIIIQNQPGADL
jgi:hypothetical protein